MYMPDSIIREARERSGLTQTELAKRAGTSRPTLSAYEHNRVSPTLDTAERLLDAAGYRLKAEPKIRWRRIGAGRGRIAWVPDKLPGLPVDRAFRQLELPLHLEWSRRDRVVNLADRATRARVYEQTLREGRPVDIESIIDGALLVELWDDLIVPMRLKASWQPLVDAARGRDVGAD